MKDCLRPKRSVMIAYLLPGVLIYILIFIVPTVMAFALSFFKFTSIRSFRFVGIQNYITLLNDPSALTALKNNLFLIIVCLIGQIGIAFILASILNSSKIFMSNMYRTVIYFPVTLSAVVIGYVWSMVYDYNYGIIVSFLKAIGRPDLVAPWLAQDSTVMLCVCIPLIWQYVGFHLVIMLSAMTSIDRDIYHMAEIDGASGIQKALFITLPMIKSTIFICVLLCISANMKVFDHIMALTNGGPGYSSNVLALYAYKVSFSQMNMGYGSTISVAILFVTVLIFGITNGITSIFRRKD
jgi:raffinose/stachyose/melibiose transport system permease protein